MIADRPHSRPISKNESRSTTASTIARILYGVRRSRGIASISHASRRSGSSTSSPRGGASNTEGGRYERNRRAASNASFSLSTSSSTVPFFAWMCDPPSPSLSTSSPSRFTTGGPATNTCDVPRTMTE